MQIFYSGLFGDNRSLRFWGVPTSVGALFIFKGETQMEKSYADAFKKDKKDKEPIDERFLPVIEEIDKTIEFLQAIRYTLKKLGQNLPDVNTTAKNVALSLRLAALFKENPE